VPVFSGTTIFISQPVNPKDKIAIIMIIIKVALKENFFTI
jgi:hypothetical protein